MRIHCSEKTPTHVFDYTGWIIKNVPNFAVMLYGLTAEFKQKEMTVLKSNHS